MPDKATVQTELEILTALEAGEVTTQISLSRRIAVSVGLINALLKRAMNKGFVKVRTAPRKRYAYYLTPTGFAEKSRLVAEYLEVSLDFFRRARSEYLEDFRRLHHRGARRVALIGGGELAEIALLAGREAGIEIVALLDHETNRDEPSGLRVARRLEDLAAVDAVAITESRHPQAAYEWVRDYFAESAIIAPPLLRISRAAGSAGRAEDRA